MEIFTRLINEGIFIFWKDTQGDKYTVKISICNKDENIEILKEEVLPSHHYFSIDKLGSGDYLVEVNSYKDNNLLQSVNKKVTLISNVQKINELADEVSQTRQNTDLINHNIDVISDIIQNPDDNLYSARYSWAKFIKNILKDINR